MDINSKEYIIYKLQEALTKYVCDLYGLILYGHCLDTPDNFNIIKNISILISELLKEEENERTFLELLKSTTTGSEEYEEKCKTFHMLRNLLTHYPFFTTWNDIFLSKKTLHWNTKGRGQIEKYFDNFSGKTLSFSLYLRSDVSSSLFMTGNVTYEKVKDFTLKIPQLGDEVLYLKDFISFEDALWLFTIVGYYLEWKNWRIEPSEKYMGLFSA